MQEKRGFLREKHTIWKPRPEVKRPEVKITALVTSVEGREKNESNSESKYTLTPVGVKARINKRKEEDL